MNGSGNKTPTSIPEQQESEGRKPGDPILTRLDVITGLVVAVLSFLVYAWTTAPNVTLLDSGEFVVAAQHFGVPHPTGYPLWTILAWLFQLLPLGNPAWEVALFSGVTGAAAVGVFASLSTSMLRWIFPALGNSVLILVAAGWAGLLAFSESMWSQAVIAEVYTLHALLVGIFFCFLYVFVRRPMEDRFLLFSVFVLSLSFSNHHLSLTLAPLPFLAVLLLRKEILWDLVAAAVLTGLLYYLLFGLLLGEPATLKTAIRTTWLVLAGFSLFVLIRRFRVEWKWVAFFPIAVGLGLLPYLYMPFASSTNPPMNWGYTRTAEGFAHSVNRSQYGGSLHEQLLRSAGKLTGTDSLVMDRGSVIEEEPWKVGRLEKMQRWTAFFWFRLISSFTLFCLPVFFLSILLIRTAPIQQRTWLYILLCGFFLSAFLQPFADGAEIDNAGWWLQMPYHTYTNTIFALICVIGTGIGIAWVSKKRPRLALPCALIWPLLILWPLFHNYGICSQRDRWFGWYFGHSMLENIPEGSVVFGGTDPGRFVPTYMIFGESTAPKHTKRDPGFDRRDLYILTQNALADPFYLKYLQDHYGPERPAAKGAFENWLDRASMYPPNPLVLPSAEEVGKIIEENTTDSLRDTEAHSEVAKWIFQKNRDAHAFFVEESFAMPWSYDHAVPHGLLYRIDPSPQVGIPAETVRADMGYWAGLVSTLLADPKFHSDFDAQRSFSKLRETTGRIYSHREMNKEAEIAFRQSLSLYPANLSALLQLSKILWEESRYEEAAEIWDSAKRSDPNNDALLYLWAVAERRKEMQTDIHVLTDRIAKDPGDKDAIHELVATYLLTADEDKALGTLKKSEAALKDDPDFLEFSLRVKKQLGKVDLAIATARALAQQRPLDGMARLEVAALELQKGNAGEFYREAAAAVRLGGFAVRERLVSDPEFRKIRTEERFQSLITSTPEN